MHKLQTIDTFLIFFWYSPYCQIESKSWKWKCAFLEEIRYKIPWIPRGSHEKDKVLLWLNKQWQQFTAHIFQLTSHPSICLILSQLIFGENSSNFGFKHLQTASFFHFRMWTLRFYLKHGAIDLLRSAKPPPKSWKFSKPKRHTLLQRASFLHFRM